MLFPYPTCSLKTSSISLIHEPECIAVQGLSLGVSDHETFEGSSCLENKEHFCPRLGHDPYIDLLFGGGVGDHGIATFFIFRLGWWLALRR
jgi:hypothetical protein